MKRIAIIAVAGILLSSAAAHAAQAKPAAQPPAGVTPPDDYVIGPADVLTITFWEEPQMSTPDAIVRPDGMITLPLLNDVPVLGLRPDQLRDRLTELAKKTDLLKDPRVSVGVRTINSRKVYVGGGVGKPGPYDLLAPMTVLQMISVAGSLREFVDGKDITIIRIEGAKQTVFRYNHKEVQAGKNLGQNIFLKPGDTISVPE